MCQGVLQTLFIEKFMYQFTEVFLREWPGIRRCAAVQHALFCQGVDIGMFYAERGQGVSNFQIREALVGELREEAQTFPPSSVARMAAARTASSTSALNPRSSRT